jgi:hypothetical protein
LSGGIVVWKPLSRYQIGGHARVQSGPGTGCPVLANAACSVATSLFQSPSAIVRPTVWIRNGRSAKEFW